MVDLLIQGGSIIDGTGKPAYIGDIAILDGKVVAAAPKLHMEAKKTVSAAGKTVIPGLIDPHVHEEIVTLIDGDMELFLRQGVTTTLNGNCGHCIFNAPTDKAIEYYWNNGLFGTAEAARYRRNWPKWEDFEGYSSFWRQGGSNINMAILQGHGTIRWLVMGGALDRKPTAKEKKRIDAILRRNMEQGAWGVSFGLSYVPSRYADTDELCDVVDVVNEYGGIAAAHLRHHIGIKPCTDEFLQVGRRTGATIQISHLTPSCPEAFLAIENAANAGMPVRVDTIPCSTGHLTRKDRMIQFIMAVSDTLFDKGEEGVKAALHNPEGRATVLKDCYMLPKDRHDLFIVNTDIPEYEGRSAADIAAEKGVDVDEFILDLLGDDHDHTFWLGGRYRADFRGETLDERIANNPYVCAGSDEIMGDPEDPLCWYELQRRGAFPIFLRNHRNAGIKVEEIVRRNTSMIADHLGFAARGRIAAGYHADIAILDLDNYDYPRAEIIDYKNPHTMASGVESVLVNGVFALENGKVVKARSGELLRHGR